MFVVRLSKVLALLVFVVVSAPEAAFACFCKTTVARITEVVWEPNEAAATRIQIHGVFATLQDEGTFEWTAPSRGFVYYACPEEMLEACRAEWSEIVDFDRSRGCAAFGSNPLENVRPPDAPAEDPDAYRFIEFGRVREPIGITCDDLQDAEPRACGNGVIEAGETCDGDCAAACEPLHPDLIRGCGEEGVLLGGAVGCDARCEYHLTFSCVDGDGCCHGGVCDETTDSDCSELVQPEETPEPALLTLPPPVALEMDLSAELIDAPQGGCSAAPLSDGSMVLLPALILMMRRERGS